MKEYLELNTLSYNVLGRFIEEAAHQGSDRTSFLLGKAAAYADMAFVLDLITRAEAEELLLCIRVYRGVQPLALIVTHFSFSCLAAAAWNVLHIKF